MSDVNFTTKLKRDKNCNNYSGSPWTQLLKANKGGKKRFLYSAQPRPRALFAGSGGCTSKAREKRPGDEVVLCCKTLHVQLSLSLNPVANLNLKTKYTNQLRKTEQS